MNEIKKLLDEAMDLSTEMAGKRIKYEEGRKADTEKLNLLILKASAIATIKSE